ncbi:unnamed protein product [Blepharisma stoltei]|uniref:ADP-ribosylglycohydrolase n=1 Tax=Blepharisma stoltei TaxID=1481888 RepID=A0AAU9IQY8_9CILI|nr:unnamed protein product [Blepharisma stoltei]
MASLQDYISQLNLITEKLTKEEFSDKIKGSLFGMAIGDALGARTEFVSKEKCIEFWQNKPLSMLGWECSMPNWEEGDWSDDTDQTLLIILSWLALERVDDTDFGARLKHWLDHGFEELGDTGGCGVGAVTQEVISHEKFLESPWIAALEVFVKRNCNLARTGAIMRTHGLGMIDYEDLGAVVRSAILMAKATHSDPRSVGSAVAVSVSISLMLKGLRNIEQVLDIAYEITRRAMEDYLNQLDTMTSSIAAELQNIYLQQKPNIILSSNPEILRKYIRPSIENDLIPLEEEGDGYTYKCMGVGFWGLSQNDYSTMIRRVITEGGDADTNAAVAGSLLGCRIGYSQLPQSLILQLKHRVWLENIADHLINKIYH